MTSGTGERQVALHGPHSDGHQIHIVNKEGYIMLFHTPSYMASRSMQPTPSGCWTVVNPWIEKQVIHVPVRLRSWTRIFIITSSPTIKCPWLQYLRHCLEGTQSVVPKNQGPIESCYRGCNWQQELHLIQVCSLFQGCGCKKNLKNFNAYLFIHTSRIHVLWTKMS